MGIFDYKFIGKLFKMESTIWLTLLLAVIATTPVSSNEPRVVCYYTNWSVYRPGTAKFNPQNINPYLCTHLIYAFGGFTKDNTLKPFDKYQDIEKGGYAKFTGLKTYNKNLKTLLAIGGWNEGSSRFSPMVASKERRKEFVRNAIKFLRQNRFDGLDLDWEYPAFRDGSKPKDRENYSRLVRELREEFERESEKTGKPRLLLTMAVPAGIEYIQKGYDVKTLNRHLDWMNLLSYDYHSAFEPAVNHHAPLYPLEEPNEYSVDTELNIDYTIKFYLENGADRNKLVLGIPTYGRSYTLFNTEAVEIGSPADGPGEQGDATREKGYLAYYEICEALKPKSKKRAIDSDEEYSEEEEEQEDEEWTVMHPNPNAMGPIAFKGNQWVGYDDIDIVRKKAEYVAENGLGGIMFWSIDNDDFRGTCHSKPYPLIEAAKEAYIQKLESSDNVIITEKPSSVSRTSNRRKNRPKTTKTTTTTTTTTEKPTTTRSNKRKSSSTTPAWGLVTPSPPTTPDPGSDFKCVDEGFFPHPRDCKKYFWCLDSGPSDLGIVAHQFTCPSGLYFNKAADSCDFARNVLCKTATTTKAPTTRAPTTKPPTTKTTVTTTTTTTTRKPIKISTRNSLLFRTTTTTTPAPEPESDEEYQDEVSEDTFDDAEDPKVIKELIDLIKKVGGIEQLEKQLHLSEASASTDGASTTTPSSFNKKLYQKVLERTRGKNKYSQNSVFENNRRAPQSQGGELAADGDQLPRKDRPQYVTINRQRSSTSTTAEPESEYSEEEEEDEEEIPEPIRARPAESSGRVGTTAKPLQYVNIRRGRPTAATSEPADDTASRNALFERQEPAVTSSPSKLDVLNARKENLPEYVTMRRQRPTTEETTTVQYQAEESEEDSRQTALEREISSQPQYNSIIRTRSTTFAPVEESTSPIPFTSRARSTTLPPVEEPSSPEPTTVLTVQISSLINSLNSEIDYPVPETTLAQATEPAEAPTTTSTTVTTTTTTTTTAAPSSIPPRRTVLRRRGSTSTTTTTTTASTPVSSTQLPKRTFQRRTRPPVVQPEVDIEKVQRGDSKYTKRNETRPATTAAPRRNERPPNRFVRRKPGGANATTLSTTSVTTSTTTRRPLRIANRRRPTATTRITTTPTTTTPNPITTAQPTTASPTTGQATTIEDILDVEPLQDIGNTDAIEEPNQEQRGTRKNNKVRRPLVTLKESPGDQNPSATNEEENKRQSKKYSSSFKQNQLDDLLKLKSRDLETTTEFKTTAVEDFNAETALAIAAHQLFSAPLPVSQNYDDEAKTTRTTQSFKYTSPQFNQFTDKTPYEEYPSTPTLRDTVSNVDFKQTTNPDTRITQYETTRTTDFQVTNPSINTFAGYSTLSTTSDSSELTSVYEPKSTGTLARANEETRTPSTNIRFNVPEGFTSRYTTGYTTTDFEPSLTTSFETQRPKYVPARASTFGYSTLTTENSRESTTEFETPKTGRSRYRPTTTTDSSETPPGVVTVVGRGSGRYSSTPYPAITNEYLETTRGIFEDPTDFTSPKVSTSASPIPTGFTSRQRISSPSVVNAGYTGVSPRSSSRSPGSSEKYGTENYGYSTVTYSPASREPSFFTRDYLLESPVTKTYDEEYQYLTPVTTPKPRKVFRKKIQRRITTTARPTTSTTVKPSTPVRPRTTTELYEKISRAPVRTYRPIVNYDYYDDSDEKVANRYAEGTKVILHEKGTIECLDVGNFPHPTSCKKFISCARMEGETIVAWEYICPKGLSFDPVGGICNWSAGLGCDEKDV